MTPTAALTFAAVLAAAPWKAEPPPSEQHVRGLDRPAAYFRRSLGQSPTAPKAQRHRACLVFPNHAVLWTMDPGLVGAPDLEVRRLLGKLPEVEACSDTFAGLPTVREPFSELVPVGAIDGQLVLIHPDGFGAVTTLRAVDLDSGRLARVVQFNWDKGVDLARSPEGLTATYWIHLGSLQCVPSRTDARCWDEIKTTHGIPKEPDLPPPDCDCAAAGWRENSAPPASAFQIAIKVREVFGRNGMESLPATPTCDLAP